MPTPFPSTAVSIKLTLLVYLNAFGTNKNPFFALFDLDSVHHRIFFLASRANFSFHINKIQFLKIDLLK